MKIHYLLLAGTLLLPHTLLHAQGTPEAPRCGFTFGVGTPMGNLKQDFEGQVLLTGSFFVPIQVGQGWVIRPNVGCMGWPAKDQLHRGGAYREKVEASAVGGGADLLFFPGGDTARGFYFSGSLGAQRWKLTYKAAEKPGGLPTHASETSLSKTSAVFGLGVGYQFNRTFGLEFRAMTSDYTALNKTVSAGTPTSGTKDTRHGTSGHIAASFTW